MGYDETIEIEGISLHTSDEQFGSFRVHKKDVSKSSSEWIQYENPLETAKETLNSPLSTSWHRQGFKYSEPSWPH